MKERAPQPPHEKTARDVAKDMIRPYVLRGDAMDATASSQMGHASRAYWAQIGGGVEVNGRVVTLKTHELAVTRLGDTPCFARFSLAALWQEVQAEAEGNETQGRLL